jgi:glutamate---cysteine ligase / carboxylate-amine ligase
VIEQRFGRSSPFSIGVEEELMLVDPGTFDQVPAAPAVLARAAAAVAPGRLKSELFASVVETNTEVCASVAEIEAALPALRRVAARAAAAEGLALAAAATHPFARPERQQVSAEPRYRSFLEYGGLSVRRQGVQGLHVHVGMPGADECWRCLELALPWLPVVLALSANSPWLAGELTGMASNRAPVLAELPRAGAPPPFGGYDAWERWVERLVSHGLAEDYTRIWWDVRPHPRLGTLEVRIADQPTDVRLASSFAALVQALCATALAGGLPAARDAPDGGRADYAQNRWAAARFGPDAVLLHPARDGTCTAADLGAELLALVASAAAELGGARALERIDSSSCEARVQESAVTARAAAALVVEATSRAG